jgi:quinol monooxygenase YgiN
MPHVNVVATVVARPGKESEVESRLGSLVAPSRQDAGCIRYDLHRDLDNAAVFVFYETWASRELLEAHLNTPHLLSWRGDAPGFIESLDVKVLERIS